MYRFHPSWLAVQERIGSGRIGELRGIEVWFSYFNDDPTNIRNILEVGGGAMWDIGCYGQRRAPPLRFRARARRQRRAARSGEQGRHPCRRRPRVRRRGAAFGCSTRVEPDQRARLRQPGPDHRGHPVQHPARPPDRGVRDPRGEPPVHPATEVLQFDPADQYTLQAEAFARAVLDGEPLPVAPADAVANIRVIERVLGSDRGTSPS